MAKTTLSHAIYFLVSFPCSLLNQETPFSIVHLWNLPKDLFFQEFFPDSITLDYIWDSSQYPSLQTVFILSFKSLYYNDLFAHPSLEGGLPEVEDHTQ